MYFNVSQLLMEPSGSSRSYSVDESIVSPDGTSQRVRGTIRMLRTDKGVWVSAGLETELVCACSRCLAECVQPTRITIEEEFFPRIDLISGAKLDTADLPEGNLYINRRHILDLADVVREYMVLVVPMKPMCRQDCAGICVTCGANLNEVRCRCDEGLRDPRWTALLSPVMADGSATGLAQEKVS